MTEILREGGRNESTIEGFQEKEENNIGTVFKTKEEIEKENMCMREIRRRKNFRKRIMKRFPEKQTKNKIEIVFKNKGRI